ncbi:hypothetical protein SAMN05216298_2988 [Glycomyces sambucus]|uniref:DUF5753 domain-containing protein n=1 Tax=Glycomyces sambucus TaxID=380244 RepID=A0A1G9I2N6_9ACTN|nr:helix-turn-helix transcriptional regulator [Glycomyces sambucus]SDL19316.1 hypothetical protein SAMN05216298_2988 [Glycomyces sambucus]
MATESELLVIVGRALRKHRDRAGKSTNDPEACAIVGSSRSLKRVEQGVRTRVNFSQVGRLCDYYGAPAQVKYELERLWRLADAKIWAQPSHAIANSGWDSYLEFEQLAVALYLYQTKVVPGLLQTEEYLRRFFAKNSFDDPATFSDLIDKRLERQDLFWSRRPAPVVQFLLDEAVLRHGCDDQQFARLLEAASWENVTIKYLPFGAGPYPMLDVPFSVLSFREPEEPSIVYLESPYERRFYERRDAVGMYHQILETGFLQAKPLKEFHR